MLGGVSTRMRSYRSLTPASAALQDTGTPFCPVEIRIDTHQVKAARGRDRSRYWSFWMISLIFVSGKSLDVTHEDIIHVPAGGIRDKTKTRRCICLGIAVNDQHPLSCKCAKAGNVKAGRCLSRPTFMVREGNGSNDIS